MNKLRVAVAMSGGVDSSVAAALLKQQGYIVTGLTMKIWDGDEKNPAAKIRNSCYSPGEAVNIENTRRIAEKLDIPFHVIDLTAEFRRDVIDYFSSEYLSGRTPNPCLRCNTRVKFEALMSKAEESGTEFDFFATGHYCRVEYDKSSKRWLLKKGKDPKKDQSYFLAFLSQHQLGRTLFPVGGYTKDEVKEIARDLGLGLEKKPESQDFVAAGYRSVISDTGSGVIKNSRGETLGEYRGISNYTIGQRKRLGISSPEPLYVTDIDPETGIVTVGGREEIYSDELTASGLNWVSVEKPESEITVKAKIRSTHREADAIVKHIDSSKVSVKFMEPQMSITPGQAVVFYREDLVLGGGIIERKKK
jgi:tRNA-uridine 2-sulfurtransferase